MTFCAGRGDPPGCASDLIAMTKRFTDSAAAPGQSELTFLYVSLHYHEMTEEYP